MSYPVISIGPFDYALPPVVGHNPAIVSDFLEFIDQTLFEMGDRRPILGIHFYPFDMGLPMFGSDAEPC